METWKKELQTSITDRASLEAEISLTEEERNFFSTEGQGSLMLRIPRRYLELIDPDAGRTDPIRIQAVPTASEHNSLGSESSDPLCEDAWSLTDRLIRRYRSRAVFLANDQCAMYCRHCFRRRFAGDGGKSASVEDIRSAAERLVQEPEVRELLISGGDPLLLSDQRLDEMLGLFSAAREDLVFRIGTRVPVTLPSRINEELLRVLSHWAAKHPLYIMTQFNHPRELDQQAQAALSQLYQAGVLLYNQTVLLSGVNDRVETLEELFNRLVANRVKPYYLFQGDLACGTSHLRTPLSRCIELEDELRGRLSGLAMPHVAVDLPQGGGKVPLFSLRLIEQRDGSYLFRNIEGREFWYHDRM